MNVNKDFYIVLIGNNNEVKVFPSIVKVSPIISGEKGSSNSSNSDSVIKIGGEVQTNLKGTVYINNIDILRSIPNKNLSRKQTEIQHIQDSIKKVYKVKEM